jgi:hypothetical protein
MVKRMLTKLTGAACAGRKWIQTAARITVIAVGTLAGASTAAASAAGSSVIGNYSAKALPGSTGAELATVIDYGITAVLILAVIGVLGALAKMASAHHGGRSATEYVPALGVCLLVAAVAGSVGAIVGGIA